MDPQALVRTLLLPRKRSAMCWDSANKSAGAIIADDNLTLTTVSTNTEVNVRSNYQIPRGRWYWEAQANSVDAAVGGCGIGICNAAQGLTSASYLGDSLNSIGWFDGGAVYRNGANVGSMQTQINGQRLRLAFDNLIVGSERIWFDRNGGVATWINGAGDPTDVSTGYFCDVLNDGPYFPAATVYNNGNSYTMKFNAVDWLYLPPTGFSMLP